MTAHRHGPPTHGQHKGLPKLLAGLALTAAYWWPVRCWFNRWGTTPEELEREMPGDGLISNPTNTATGAVTVNAPPEDIWPWLVQMGSGRGGLYSYDWLDRVFGFLDRPSATRILPEFQQLAVWISSRPFSITNHTGVATPVPSRLKLVTLRYLPGNRASSPSWSGPAGRSGSGRFHERTFRPQCAVPLVLGHPASLLRRRRRTTDCLLSEARCSPTPLALLSADTPVAPQRNSRGRTRLGVPAAMYACDRARCSR
jgi:hypothetical protein